MHAALGDEIRIGVDLGGTKTEAVVLRLSGGSEMPEVLATRRQPTDRDRGYDHVVEQTAAIVRDVAETAGLDRLPPIGVGMPGSTTLRRSGAPGERADTPLIKNSNTTCLNGKPFHRDLERALGQSITFANDANCFTLAEAAFGAAKGARVTFGVIMGTGVGGGIAWRSPSGLSIWEGAQGIAGEWGHISLEPASGPRCYCGRRGCVEQYLSGPAITRDYDDRAGERFPPDVIVKRRANDPNANACIDFAIEMFGRALATVINVLDPNVIVLGGGVSKLDFWLSDGVSAVRRWVFSDTLETRIVRHALSDSAGVIGAALLPDAVSGAGTMGLASTSTPARLRS